MSDWEEKPTIRRSQTITPFGVGAIYEWTGQSFVACDTDEWGEAGEPLKLDRLANELGVSGFKQAPEVPKFSSDSRRGTPYMRFPTWQFCPNCRRLKQFLPKPEESSKRPLCICRPNQKMSPMRWVKICAHGHLSDVNWRRWVHKGTKCKKFEEDIFYEVEGGSTYEAIQIRAACGVKRSLDGIMIPGAAGRCEGRQPWEFLDYTKNAVKRECKETTQVALKGGSNIQYPRIISALDIPPRSNFARVGSDSENIHNLKSDLKFAELVHHERCFVGGEIQLIPENDCRRLAIAYDLEHQKVQSILYEEWVKIFEPETYPDQEIGITDSVNLKISEFKALTLEGQNFDDRDNFITEHTSLQSSNNISDSVNQLESFISKVVLVKRLREVKALTGFTRLIPGGEKAKIIQPDLGNMNLHNKWLPASESFGEGIFLQFNEDHLNQWESKKAVKDMETATREKVSSANAMWLSEPTARFIALHTFAHSLIRQLTFDCGYPSSSLRERIYSQTPTHGEPMAGILIYTTSGDAEGSLGGLVRQGQAPRLLKTIFSTIENLMFCSTDPVCSEIRSGFGSINSGACHACTLISETSCTEGNLLLDRNILINEDGLLGALIRSQSGGL